ncbi:unnamed protein product [Cuscuta epithymum]|uniref:Uncharacterized protein n=1 Tax=Cuscuta epithymum TaxID=186058 RepID=A0AAV0DG24_9ASTE|nr:unnamed protein product [Cuscuta epithymum]
MTFVDFFDFFYSNKGIIVNVQFFYDLGNILDCASQTCHNTIAAEPPTFIHSKGSGTRYKYIPNLQPKGQYDHGVTYTPEDDQVDYDSAKPSPPIIHNNPQFRY